MWTARLLNNPCHADYFYVLHSSPIFSPVNLQLSSCKHVFSISVENTVDPDQMALLEAICSGSTLFTKEDISSSAKQG